MTRYVMWSVAGVIVLVRILFVATYPLHDQGGDSYNYLWMLVYGQSSLVHAGGYPFLFGLPLRILGIGLPLSAKANYAILIAQHIVDLLILAVLYRVTRALFGRLAGAIAVLLAGLNIQGLAAASAVYPEWLQGDLFVLALSAAFYAFVRTRDREKLAWYAASALAFSWCFLVKFNVAVLGFFLLAAIATDSVTWRRKALTVAACTGVAIASLAGFELLFHHPTTGAYALTYDTAWVLLTRVHHFRHNTLDPNDGLNTKRWLALSSVLPPSYNQAGPGLFSRVDAVDQEIREPYRRRYLFLVNATEYQASLMLKHTSLPEGFSVQLSAIPIGYYIGLPESDHLGVKVAREAIRAHPGEYAAAIWRDLAQAARQWPGDAPLATTTNLAMFGVSHVTPLAHGYVRGSRESVNSAIAYSTPAIWWPGLRLFTALHVHGLPAYWPTLAVVLAFLAAAGRIAVARRVELQPAVALLLVLMVVVMVVVSVATLAFRWKEARVLLPLVSVLAGSAFANAVAAGSLMRAILAGRSRHTQMA